MYGVDHCIIELQLLLLLKKIVCLLVHTLALPTLSPLLVNSTLNKRRLSVEKARVCARNRMERNC